MFTSQDFNAFITYLERVMKHKRYIIQKQIDLMKMEGSIFDFRVMIQKTHYGNLGELGIDLGIDSQHKIWLIEVNGYPSISMFSEYFVEDAIKLYNTPIQYACYLADLRQKRRKCLKKGKKQLKRRRIIPAQAR